MAGTRCCECEREITLEAGTVRGEILQCPDCGLEMEVVSLDPVRLERAPQEEEDWGE